MTRRKDLTSIRNKKIVEKFHELYDKKRMRMDDVLYKLSTEHFFLDKDYIYSLIFYNKKNKEYYYSLFNNKSD